MAKQEQIHSAASTLKNAKKRSKVKIIIIVLLCITLVGILAGVGFLGYRFYEVSQDLPDVSNVDVLAMADKSTIYAADEQTILADLQEKNRQPVNNLEEVSQNLIDATIATEDVKFYQHNGVDIFGLIRAAFTIATGGNTQGGSTITMQLMRNTVLAADAQKITLDRKIAEIILAIQAEKNYSKDEILLMYLNTINYGDGSYGIKAAAEHYFSKDPLQLSVTDSALLAGIPQAPTYLNPTIYPEASLARRNVVLTRMRDTKKITKEECAQYQQEPLNLNLGKSSAVVDYLYPYYTSYVRDLVQDMYPEVNIYSAGWKIYTALDVAKQEATEAACEEQEAKLEQGCVCAAVTVDPTNAYVTSIVGGNDFETNQFNVAVYKGRPTGSSFKAFTLLTSIEEGYCPQKDTLDCTSPMNVGGTSISNFGGISYGTKTIEGALDVSSNTGFVRLQQKVGTDKVVEVARKLGIKEANLPNVTTLTLGSADITPLEMASAYATIANGGTYMTPVVISRIESRDGSVVYDHTTDENVDKGTRVATEEVCGAATKALKTVFTRGTATSAQLDNGQPVAGKTGTSEEYRDHTLVGYMPDCVCSTWIGKLDYTPTRSSVSCNYLFKSIMDKICNGRAIIEFPTYADPPYKTGSKQTEQKKTNDPKSAPSVVGQNITAAKSTLSAYSLTIYQEYSSTIASGIVIRQEVNGDRVVLYVSKGPKPKTNG